MTSEESCSASGLRPVRGDIELCRRRSPSPQPSSSRTSQEITERELASAQPERTSDIVPHGAIINDREGVQCASPEHEVQISIATPREVESLRYERPPKNVSKVQIAYFDPMCRSFKCRSLPETWVRHKHPDGKRYFLYPARVLDHNILTHADIYDPEVLRDVVFVCTKLEHELRKAHIADDITSSNFDVVIEFLPKNDGPRECWVYFACWQSRLVFWLEQMPIERLTKGEREVWEPTHQKCLSRSEFWKHVEMFPYRQLPRGTEEKLWDMMSYGFMDHLTSEGSTAPLGPVELERLMKLLKKSNGPTERLRPGEISSIGRIMSFFYHSRFLNFHGQHEALLDRKSPLFEIPTECSPMVTWVFGVVSMSLFWMPHAYMCKLQGIYINGTVDYVSWQHFLWKLKDDWRRSIILATVLLAAGVSVLNIPGWIDSTLAVVTCLISMVLCITIFILSLVLEHSFHVSSSIDIASVAELLGTCERHALGIRGLATIISLPVALLIWSILSLVTSISAFFFSSEQHVIRVLLFIVLTVLVSVILVAIIVVRPNQPWLPSRSRLQHEVKKALGSKWFVGCIRRLKLQVKNPTNDHVSPV